MTLLKTITAVTDTTDPFAPGGEFRLQVTSVAPTEKLIDLVIDVEASVDATDGEWSPIYSWRLTEGAIKRFAEQTRVRVKIRGNTEGNAITVRHS